MASKISNLSCRLWLEVCNYLTIEDQAVMAMTCRSWLAREIGTLYCRIAPSLGRFKMTGKEIRGLAAYLITGHHTYKSINFSKTLGQFEGTLLRHEGQTYFARDLGPPLSDPRGNELKGVLRRLHGAVDINTGALVACLTPHPEELEFMQSRGGLQEFWNKMQKELVLLTEVINKIPGTTRTLLGRLDKRQGTFYLLQKFCRKGDLATRLDQNEERSDLSRLEMRRIMEKLAATVQALHRAGIAHCDLKPDNILLADNGDPILTDFDHAQKLVTGSAFTNTFSKAMIEDDIRRLGFVFFTILQDTHNLEGGHLPSQFKDLIEGMRSMDRDTISSGNWTGPIDKVVKDLAACRTFIPGAKVEDMMRAHPLFAKLLTPQQFALLKEKIDAIIDLERGIRLSTLHESLPCQLIHGIGTDGQDRGYLLFDQGLPLRKDSHSHTYPALCLTSGQLLNCVKILNATKEIHQKHVDALSDEGAPPLTSFWNETSSTGYIIQNKIGDYVTKS